MNMLEEKWKVSPKGLTFQSFLGAFGKKISYPLYIIRGMKMSNIIIFLLVYRKNYKNSLKKEQQTNYNMFL